MQAFKADSSHFGAILCHFVLFFCHFSGVQLGLWFIQGFSSSGDHWVQLWSLFFCGLGYSLEMPKSFGRRGQGGGLNLLGQNALLLRKLFWEPEQLPKAPFQMCCTSGAHRKCWMSWSCPSSSVNPSRVESASPLEITAGGCRKQCR